jgi:hypothetical protein
VGMKLPLRMLLPIAWRGMQSHRIREWRVEYLIVGRCNGLQNCRELQPFCVGHLLELGNMPSRQNHDLKWPHRPVRHHGDEARVDFYQSLAQRLFHRKVGA